MTTIDRSADRRPGGVTYPAPTAAVPEGWEDDARLTLRPGWCHLEVAGLALAVWPDAETGAPVLEVDTRALDETAGGPVMRLTVNDHDYLDNADGAGAPMSPAGVLAAAITTVTAALGEAEAHTLRQLLLDAEVLGSCPQCGEGMLPGATTCPVPKCGIDTTDGDSTDWCRACEAQREWTGNACATCGHVWGYDPGTLQVTGVLVLQRWEGDQAVEVGTRRVNLPLEWLVNQDRAALAAAADHAGERDWIVEELGMLLGHDGPFELTIDVDPETGDTELHRWLVETGRR